VSGETIERASAPLWRMSAEASALRERFPPRPVPAAWPAACQDRSTIVRFLLHGSNAAAGARQRFDRRTTLLRVLDWLEGYPGSNWQQRWKATGVEEDPAVDWRARLLVELRAAGRLGQHARELHNVLGLGLLQLLGADVLRPDLGWLLSTGSPTRVALEMARIRDPGGFAALRAAGAASAIGAGTVGGAIERIARIAAAKGGTVRQITPGDCIDLLVAARRVFPDSRSRHHSPFFYQLLHATGALPAGAPASVRMFSTLFLGQLSVEQLVDRYDLACRPIRDLLVDYLRERQPALDYSTLNDLSTELALWFWKDLEQQHPGIDSLRLAPDIAAAWKQRLRTKTLRNRTSDGRIVESVVERAGAPDILMRVRAFYLDLAQWALDDPVRWGPWATTCPIRAQDIGHKKAASRRKARMDQRTRQRLPHLPALAEALERARVTAAQTLTAALAAEPGALFTAADRTLRRSRLRGPSPRIWAEDPGTGHRLDLGRAEEHAFWAWAAVEVLRSTGIRIEELTELSHHSLVQYRLPATGELIPLLQIAPSKTDEERLLVVSPELADVLTTVICRIRGVDGAVPLVAAYDAYECVWNPPMPLLFQRTVGLEHRPLTIGAVRTLIHQAVARAGPTDQTGQPLVFSPHDFRRLFTTEAILSGMPPHIAQLLLGHKDINTTMGYKAVYPQEAINGHRAFLARRRALRPAEEYRTPTEAEWDEFLGHFERRRVALGDCGRAYGSSCIHEHSCIRCPLLRVDPRQRPRLLEIRDNLTARIAEASREGWGGEAEGLKVSLAAAADKLTQIDALAARRSAAVDLGIPAYRDIAASMLTSDA
jgi:integrase